MSQHCRCQHRPLDDQLPVYSTEFFFSFPPSFLNIYFTPPIFRANGEGRPSRSLHFLPRSISHQKAHGKLLCVYSLPAFSYPFFLIFIWFCLTKRIRMDAIQIYQSAIRQMERCTTLWAEVIPEFLSGIYKNIHRLCAFHVQDGSTNKS